MVSKSYRVLLRSIRTGIGWHLLSGLTGSKALIGCEPPVAKLRDVVEKPGVFSVGEDLIAEESMHRAVTALLQGTGAVEMFAKDHSGLCSTDIMTCSWSHDAKDP